MVLADAARTRDNNVKLIRLLAALSVLLFHSYGLSGHVIEEPLWRLIPQTNFGVLGVEIFFVLSGFLITQSWIARADLRAFTVARVLRIYPALFAATLLTLALAALSSHLSLVSFLSHPQTHAYFLQTAIGYRTTLPLPDAFVANPFPNAANGSLWTLPLELQLYLVVAIAGVLALVADARRWLPTLAALALAFYLMVEPAARVSEHMEVVRNLVLLFALGSACYVARSRLPLSLPIAAACIALYVANPAPLPMRGLLALPLLAYAVLVGAYHPRLQLHLERVRWFGDYSYGAYVYAFPIQQTLIMLAPALGPLALFAAALPLVAVPSVLSWHFLEFPALSLKPRFAAPSPRSIS